MIERFFDRIIDYDNPDISTFRAALGCLVLLVGSWAVVIGIGALLYWMVRGIW